MTSQLSSALRAAAEGIHPNEAAAGLIISQGTFLLREDFIGHVETAACISDGTPMAWMPRWLADALTRASLPDTEDIERGWSTPR